MTFVARRAPDGSGYVLNPDGLTWEAHLSELGEAERFADELNAWLDSKPVPGGPELLLDVFTPGERDDEATVSLFAIIDRFYEPERKLIVLAASL